MAWPPPPPPSAKPPHQPGGLLAVDGDRGAAAGHGRAAVPKDGDALCGCDLNAMCM